MRANNGNKNHVTNHRIDVLTSEQIYSNIINVSMPLMCEERQRKYIKVI